MNTNNDNIATLNNNGETWHEIPSVRNLLLAYVDKEFKYSVNLNNDGANNVNNSERCLHAAAAMIDNHQTETFDAETFYKYCAPFPELTFEFKRDFFRRFTSYLIDNKRCEAINGCYSENVFRLL